MSATTVGRCLALAALLAGCAAPQSAGRTGAPTSQRGSPPAAAGPAKPWQATWSRTAPPPPLPAVAAEEAPVHRTTLRNGLKVVVVEHRRRPLVALRLVFGAGAASEEPSQAGVTNLALALLRDRFERKNENGELLASDEKSARRQAADVGATLRHGVSHDASWLGLDGYSADTAKYLDRLRDVLWARRQGEVSFAGRREGLLDAIDDLELGDDATLGEHVLRLAFGPGHTYARRVAGTASSLGALGIGHLAERQNEVLRPQGAALLVVGSVAHEAVFAKAARVFDDWRDPPGPALPAPTRPPVTKRKAVLGIPGARRAPPRCAPPGP